MAFVDICWYFTLYLIFIVWLRFVNHLLNYYLLTYLLTYSFIRRGHSIIEFNVGRYGLWRLRADDDDDERRVVSLAVPNFTSVGARGGYAAPKRLKISTFGKDWPLRGEHFDRFLQILAAFMRPVTLCKYFKFIIIIIIIVICSAPIYI